MARRRFEFEEGGSSKFWEVELKGNRHVIRYGKLGTAGQSLDKTFVSKEVARTATNKLIRQKLEKGYREVTGVKTLEQRGSVPPKGGLLCQAIYREAARLGADIRGQRDLPKSVKRCPAHVREFYCRIIWPKRSCYHTEVDDCSMDGITFVGPVQAFDASAYDVAGCGKNLFGIGSVGENWILLLDGNDKNASDPTVYEVDHHPEPGDRLGSRGRLSRFLARLRTLG